MMSSNPNPVTPSFLYPSEPEFCSYIYCPYHSPLTVTHAIYCHYSCVKRTTDVSHSTLATRKELEGTNLVFFPFSHQAVAGGYDVPHWPLLYPAHVASTFSLMGLVGLFAG